MSKLGSIKAGLGKNPGGYSLLRNKNHNGLDGIERPILCRKMGIPMTESKSDSEGFHDAKFEEYIK